MFKKIASCILGLTSLIAVGQAPTTYTYPALSTNNVFTNTNTFPSLFLNNITGSTQCIQVDSSGHVSGTGQTCGNGAATILLTPSNNQTVTQPVVGGVPTNLVVNTLHSNNGDYSCVNNIGDSISVGYGTTNQLPGILGTPSQPLGFAWLIDAAYGNGGHNIAFAGDQSPDQSYKTYEVFAAHNEGNCKTTIMNSTNDALNCGTSASCQQTFTYSMNFEVAQVGIPQEDQVAANSSFCSSSGFAADGNFPFGMQTTTNGATLTCTLITTNSTSTIYNGFLRTTGSSGSITVTVDGQSCRGDNTLTSSGYATTGNGQSKDLSAGRCSGIAAGTHHVVFTSTSGGSSEIIFTGAPTTALATAFAPPSIYVGGTPYESGDAGEPNTGIYDALTQSLVTTWQADGLPVTFVNIRNYLNTTTSFTGGVVGNTSWASSNALPIHPGPLGHLQMFHAFRDQMQPVMKSSSKFLELYAGAHSRIGTWESTSGTFGDTDTTSDLTVISEQDKSFAPQEGMHFIATGANDVSLYITGQNSNQLTNTTGFYDNTHVVYPWIFDSIDDFCLYAPASEGANPTTGCPFSAFFMRGDSVSPQFVLGAQSNAVTDSESVGANPASSQSIFKLRGTNTYSWFDAESTGAGGTPGYAVYNAQAPTGNRLWTWRVEADGVYRVGFCADTNIATCTDAINFNPSTDIMTSGNGNFTGYMHAVTGQINGSNICTVATGCPTTSSVATGLATLSGGTTTVSTSVACAPGSSCVYKLTNCGAGSSTTIGTLEVGAETVGSSFTINSVTAANVLSTGDISKVCWQIN